MHLGAKHLLKLQADCVLGKGFRSLLTGYAALPGAQVPPIAVADMLGLPPAETSSVSAFVQSFLHEVWAEPVATAPKVALDVSLS